MAKSVKKFCKRCLGCQLRKKSANPHVGKLRTSIYTKPFSAIGVDLIEMPPGESDSEGKTYHYIFHAVCLFSNYVIARPLFTKTMSEVARCLFNEIICQHGYFGTIRSDRGKEFCNSLLDELYKIGHVDVQRTSSLRAQFNGQCERAHRFPLDALAILCSGREKLWPQFLQPVTFAHNTNVGTGRLFSPYFITHGGRNPPSLPDLMVRRAELIPDPTDIEIDSMAVDMVESMKMAHVCVRLALIDARLHAKNKYDQNRSLPDFSEGDLVGLRSPQRQSKLSYRWRGPYVVADPCNNTVLLKSVTHGPPSPSSRINVDRLIHLNLSGLLDPNGQTDVETPIMPVRAAMDVDGPEAPNTPISHPSGQKEPKDKGLEPVTTSAATGYSSSGGDALDTIPQELDTSRHFALVDRTLYGDYLPVGTTADDRDMVAIVYEACPEQGLSPHRVVELIMGHAGYRRGYIKHIPYHTMSLALDRYGWIQKIHDNLYFVEDLLGEGYSIGEILQQSLEDHKYLVEYYRVTRPGGDIICKENYFPPTWHLEHEIMFPLAVTTEDLPNGQLRLDRDSVGKLHPYNFDFSDYEHPSPGEFESQL